MRNGQRVCLNDLLDVFLPQLDEDIDEFLGDFLIVSSHGNIDLLD